MPIKKTLVVGWVLIFTLYTLFMVHFNLWTKRPRALADFANQEQSNLWGKTILKYLGVRITTKGEPISKEATLFVGNHVSYLDIPLFFTLRHATFVAKKEVSRWPIFGRATTSVGTIFVDRSSMKSRAATSVAMRAAIKERGLSVVIFPEGTSSLSGKPWRAGALGMAKDADLWVQPFAIHYRPGRPVAYIDDDSFLPHLWRWVGSIRVEAQIHFFAPRKISDARADTLEIQNFVQEKWRELESERLSPC